jgi:GGDEF domain-containing protein
MYRLRLWTIILIAWLLFIVNVEQSSEKFLDIGRSSEGNILAWYSYIFIGAVALAVLVVPILAPALRNLSLRAMLPVVTILFLAAKLYFKRHDTWAIEDVLRATTELSAIVLTLWLSYQLSRALYDFHQAVAASTIPRVGMSMKAFSTGQGKMYQEVQRARQYNRPLALLALKINEDSLRKVALPAILREAQQAMAGELVLAGVAGALCDELRDYDLIGQQDGYFLVLLPETMKEDVPDVATRLRNVVAERAGVKLRVAAVTFPDNALTFDGLVQQAIQQVETSPDAMKRSVAPDAQAALEQP